jgi:hypothetical protein
VKWTDCGLKLRLSCIVVVNKVGDMTQRASTESIVREIRRKTRKKYSAEEKTHIVLEGLHYNYLKLHYYHNGIFHLKYSERYLQLTESIFGSIKDHTFISEQLS